MTCVFHHRYCHLKVRRHRFPLILKEQSNCRFHRNWRALSKNHCFLNVKEPCRNRCFLTGLVQYSWGLSWREMCSPMNPI